MSMKVTTHTLERAKVRAVDRVAAAEVGERLGLNLDLQASTQPLTDWSMTRDDAPILAALFAAFRPGRHLEFGTWQGFGARLVLQHCDATVWTLNLPDGEPGDDGGWAYAEGYDQPGGAPRGAGPAKDFREGGGKVYYQSDAHGFIGRLVHEAGLGHRLCQVLCDSRDWDTTAYPRGFFDTVLIDGGHATEVVCHDTRQALPLLRPGGLMLWHDYCPEPAVIAASPAVAGVTAAIEQMGGMLTRAFEDLFWIEPSHLLVGVRGA